MGAADRWLVIGVGNPERGDDGAGRAVARLLARNLAERKLSGVEVVESDGGAAELLELWHDRDRVVLVDACRGGGAPGTVHVFDAVAAPLPADLLAADARASSHGLGPAHAVELARALGRLPRRLAVYAIEAGRFDAALAEPASLSPSVDRAAARLADELAALCRAVLSPLRRSGDGRDGGW